MNRIHKVGASKPNADEAEKQKELIREVASEFRIEKDTLRDGGMRYTSMSDPTKHFTVHEDVILTGAYNHESAIAAAKVARYSGWTAVEIDGTESFYNNAADYLTWESGVAVSRTSEREERQEAADDAQRLAAAEHEPIGMDYSEPSEWNDSYDQVAAEQWEAQQSAVVVNQPAEHVPVWNTTIKGKDVRSSDPTEVARRRALHKEIATEYNVSDYDTESGVISYRLKASPKIGFSQRDVVISLNHDDDRLTRGAAMLADANGWKSVTLRGNDRFYEVASGTLGKSSLPISLERVGGSDLERSDTTAGASVKADYKARQDGVNISASAAANRVTREKRGKPIVFKEIESETNSATPKTTADSIVMSNDERDKHAAKLLAMRQRLQEQYRVAGNKWYIPDQRGHKNELAFVESDTSIKTSLNTERVSKSVIELAAAKGWTSVHLKGHKDFRRQSWREAQLRGIETTGYKPTQADLENIGRSNKIKELGNEVVRTHVRGEDNQKLVNDAITDRVTRIRNPPDISSQQQEEKQDALEL